MRDIPRIEKRGTTTQLIIDGSPFIVLGGQVHNSSSSSLEYMERRVWDRVVELQCNTAITPVYWELVEPVEGTFDFSLVDGLLEQARARGLRLILLWFATWKNTHSSYAPAWVKTDMERFPRAQRREGEDCGSVSCLSTEARDADARAFAALMRHLAEVDADDRTVIMVQVQNETGLLGAARDHSPLANREFAGPVPGELLRHVARNAAALRLELRTLWESAGSVTSGTWREAFGVGADEVFMAWHIARFVQYVAAAGVKEYPLPLYANVWLVQSQGQEPGAYPSGGPVSRMMDVWHLAAPDIFTLAPDIYVPWFAEVCADYDRDDNPLLIPEARREAALGPKCLYAVGRHDAMCFAPFGVESIDSPEAVYVDGPVADGAVKLPSRGAGRMLAGTYRVLRGMMPLVAAHQGRGSMTAFLQGKNAVDIVEFGGYRLRVGYTEPARDSRVPGGGLVINTAPDEFVVAGVRCRIDFLPPEGGKRTVEYLSLDEGEYVDGSWVPSRRLNGDEQALRLGDGPGVRRARLHAYD